jgi:NAD(P)-dependent dehydrogenase (short-subunit alcohol dehydrogenase family)
MGNMRTSKNPPGRERAMRDKPRDKMENYKAAGKLIDKVAIVTGGDSGIGRAISIGFAKEGAKVVISYLDEDTDARETAAEIKNIGGEILLIPGDIGNETHAARIVRDTLKQFGKLDIVVNNAGEQHPQDTLENISKEQLLRTFQTNIFAQFFLVKAALAYLKKGAAIINTASVTMYKGKPTLIDYSATKGAVIAFTRSLSGSLANKGIRVNAVAPGPIWTPLIPSTFTPKEVKEFGKNTPLGRPGQPDEVAPCFVFLASEDASYITGQVLHPNGGTIVNG